MEAQVTQPNSFGPWGHGWTSITTLQASIMPLARLRLGDACIANTTEKEYKLGDYGTDGNWGLARDWL